MRPLTDDEAEMVHRNLPLVRWCLKRQRCKDYATWHDLRAAGYLGLCRAVMTYDSTKGALSTYAKYWINVYVRQEIRALSLVRVPAYHFDSGTDARHRASQAHLANQAQAASRLISWNDAHTNQVANRQPEESELRHSVACRVARLSIYQRIIVRRIVMHGDRPCEVAKDLGLSDNQVHNLKKQAIRKLKKALADLAPKTK